jgi:hypothetical protein
MARPERFELPASWFVARRSIQLSYGRTLPHFGGANITTGIIDPSKSMPWTGRESGRSGPLRTLQHHPSFEHIGGEGGIVRGCALIPRFRSGPPSPKLSGVLRRRYRGGWSNPGVRTPRFYILAEREGFEPSKGF